MAPSYILGRNIAPMNTTSAIKLRLVRTYEIPERRGAATIKCKECVFHDQEGTILHGTIPRDLVHKYSTRLKVSISYYQYSITVWDVQIISSERQMTPDV
nr:putative transposase [Ipomoea batatas]